MELRTYINVFKCTDQILQSLEFANENFVKLKSFTFTFEEHAHWLTYDKDQGEFNYSVNYFKHIVNYGNKFAAYKGKAKVKFNHYIRIHYGCCYSKKAARSYAEKLKDEYTDFKCSYEPGHSVGIYSYKRSIDITTDVKLNTEMILEY